MSLGVSVSMAGFLAGECLCEAGGLSESVVDRAMRAAEQKQQQANTANHPSHGKCPTCVVATRSAVLWAKKIGRAVRNRKPPLRTVLPPGEYKKKQYSHSFVFGLHSYIISPGPDLDQIRPCSVKMCGILHKFANINVQKLTICTQFCCFFT